jgi:hypothetical protein
MTWYSATVGKAEAAVDRRAVAMIPTLPLLGLVVGARLGQARARQLVGRSPAHTALNLTPTPPLA